MRLFHLTFATVLHRKSWVICLFAVLVLPFALPMISSATEKPLLVQPARVLAAWGSLWFCTLVWGLFTAAHEGEANAKSGLGEYFLTSGSSATSQLLQIWLAIFSYIAGFTVVTALVCHFAATPADPVERAMWGVLNAQYTAIFLIVTAPLLALSTAVASRFGSVTGFTFPLLIALYGLYGVGYLENMLKLESNSLLQAVWLCSPHYRFADLTQRLYFKTGALPSQAFWMTTLYFMGIFAVHLGLSRLLFRPKPSA